MNGGTNSHFEKIKLLRPEKIFAVHINNADDVPAEEMGQDKRRFCDSGAVDLKAFLLALKGAGYDGMVSIETFRPEYWRKSCDWVIDEAYKTTKDCLKGAGVL